MEEVVIRSSSMLQEVAVLWSAMGRLLVPLHNNRMGYTPCLTCAGLLEPTCLACCRGAADAAAGLAWERTTTKVRCLLLPPLPEQLAPGARCCKVENII